MEEKDAVLAKQDLIRRNYLLGTRVSVNPTAGTVLQHCKLRVVRFRTQIGQNVCVFKIGYTSNPLVRFRSYMELNYSSMSLLHVTMCKGSAEMLEAALIDLYKGTTGCRNEKAGGDGPVHLQADVFYVYIVGARADQAKRIG